MLLWIHVVVLLNSSCFRFAYQSGDCLFRMPPADSPMISQCRLLRGCLTYEEVPETSATSGYHWEMLCNVRLSFRSALQRRDLWRTQCYEWLSLRNNAVSLLDCMFVFISWTCFLRPNSVIFSSFEAEDDILIANCFLLCLKSKQHVRDLNRGITNFLW